MSAIGCLVVRADADAKMGTGHVMRMLALADAWRDLSKENLPHTGNSSGQASNLFLRQLTTSPTASSVVKVEFLGGTASDITVNAFGIDSYPDPKKISSWRDWVKVTASDGTSTFDPSSITTSVANEIPHNSQIQWFNNNFPGAGVAQTNVVRGLSEVTDTSADGNAEFAFAQTGITELEIEYWNSWEEEHPHNTNSEQWIGLLNRMEFTATLVPEPSTYASLLVGLLCAAGVAWYRKKHLAAA